MTLRVAAALILLTACAAPRPNRAAPTASVILPDRLYFVNQAAPSLDVVRRAIDAAIAGDDAQLAYVISLVRYTDGEGGENYGDSLNDLQQAVTQPRFRRVLATLDPQVREQATICMDIAQQIREYVRSKRPNHAMQPTPGRRTLKFSMTPTFYPAATRALASGG